MMVSRVRSAKERKMRTAVVSASEWLVDGEDDAMGADVMR